MRNVKYLDKRVPDSKHKSIRWFELDQFEPERAFTSHWISTNVFFIIRFVLTLYSTITFWTFLAVSITYSSFVEFFSVFTTLTFIGLYAYQVASLIHHVRYILSNNVTFLLKQSSYLNYLYQWLYVTIVVFNVLTPVVFWSFLNASGETIDVASLNWLNISVHGISPLIMMTDVIFNRMKLPVHMIFLAFIILIFYLFLAFIVYAIEDVWVYPFLDWSKGHETAVWYSAVAILVVLIYLFMFVIHFLRDRIALKLGRK